MDTNANTLSRDHWIAETARQLRDVYDEAGAYNEAASLAQTYFDNNPSPGTPAEAIEDGRRFAMRVCAGGTAIIALLVSARAVCEVFLVPASVEENIVRQLTRSFPTARAITAVLVLGLLATSGWTVWYAFRPRSVVRQESDARS